MQNSKFLAEQLKGNFDRDAKQLSEVTLQMRKNPLWSENDFASTSITSGIFNGLNENGI